jgi:hypothetical protein
MTAVTRAVTFARAGNVPRRIVRREHGHPQTAVVISAAQPQDRETPAPPWP